MELNINKDWLLRMAEKEGCGIVSVGGLIGESSNMNSLSLPPAAERSALAQLIEWQRRKFRWSVDELAKHANLKIDEVLAIEKGESITEAGTLFQLSAVLNLSNEKLMRMAGLVEEHDPKLEIAASRFIAYSTPMSPLSVEQEAALEEFVRVINE